VSIISSGLQSGPNVSQLFTAVIYGFAKKDRAFVPVRPVETSLMFVGAYPIVEHLKGASLVYGLTLPANIRLGRKGLPGTNSQAYYKNSQNMALKTFITLG
jgi:hypothetical protein